jgi:hypothetical protein
MEIVVYMRSIDLGRGRQMAAQNSRSPLFNKDDLDRATQYVWAAADLDEGAPETAVSCHK